MNASHNDIEDAEETAANSALSSCAEEGLFDMVNVSALTFSFGLIVDFKSLCRISHFWYWY